MLQMKHFVSRNDEQWSNMLQCQCLVVVNQGGIILKMSGQSSDQVHQFCTETELISFVFNNRCNLIRVMVHLEPIPGRYALAGMPIYHTLITHVFTHSFTPRRKSESPIHLSACFCEVEETTWTWTWGEQAEPPHRQYPDLMLELWTLDLWGGNATHGHMVLPWRL